MTGHLAECELHGNGCAHDYYSDPPLQCANCGESCICPALRARERRVRTVYAISHVRDEQAADGIAFGNGYAAGLDAAEAAVLAVDPASEEYDDWYPKGERLALAAIRALKEKP